MKTKLITKADYDNKRRELELELLKSKIEFFKRRNAEDRAATGSDGRTLDALKGRTL